jgi:tetratricopeptide (TPR) repeat protein
MPRNHTLRLVRRYLVPVASVVLAAGCASAGKKYDQARQMEAQGRAADAAQRYVDALKHDPNLADARERLQETGDQAVRDYLAEAAQLASAGRPDAAADRYFDADALRRAATGVGVELRVPDDYVAHRTTTFDRAIDAALSLARDAGARGDWDTGISRLERAAQRYQPTSEQARALNQARYDALLGHARDEMARGRFRSSFDVAARALEVFGRYGPDADAALAVQREALQRGSVRVAVLPIGVREAVRDTLPLDLVPSLWQAMTTQKWNRPPNFVEFVRQDRWTAPRWGRGGREVNPYDAAALGRQLGADLVVVLTVDSARREDALTTDRRPAKTKSGTDTAYTVNRGRRTLWTRVRYEIVQVGSRRTLAWGTEEARTGAPMEFAVYAGDPDVLEVPRGDRDLFHRNWERPVNEEIVRETVDQLDDRLADAIYQRLLAQVP